MKYDNTDVRRQDRLLNEDTAYRLLHNGEYGVLSMIDNTDSAYGIPINYVYDNENDSIYFHCAVEGKKLQSITSHPQVSFCIIGHTNVVSSKFTTEYESIVISGYISKVTSDEERHHALKQFLLKYSPNDVTTGMKYAEKSFHRTEILKLSSLIMSGKTKKIHIQNIKQTKG